MSLTWAPADAEPVRGTEDVEAQISVVDPEGADLEAGTKPERVGQRHLGARGLGAGATCQMYDAEGVPRLQAEGQRGGAVSTMTPLAAMPTVRMEVRRSPYPAVATSSLAPTS